MPYSDLMRVVRIVIERGAYLARFNQLGHRPWQVREERSRSIVFSRPLPNAGLPGSLAWPAQGALMVTAIGKAKAEHESFRIERRDASVGMLVFARPYWPNYEATLDGAPLAVHALDGLLLAVDFPPGAASGVFELRYRPRYMRAGFVLALCGMALLMAGTAASYRRSRLGGRTPV